MLASRLTAALDSRIKRQIRRTLPTAPTTISGSAAATSPALADFTTNDYLSLSTSPVLLSHTRAALESAPSTHILGSGGSRLLVYSPAHAELEERLQGFFNADAALLFNSGFDANVGLFSCLPQEGDAVVYDEYVHASVHDGLRTSRVPKSNRHAFQHNDLASFEKVLKKMLHEIPMLSPTSSGSIPQKSLFVAVESLYSMDGTFAPLTEMVNILEQLFPARNAYIIVDEAHATGMYGDHGRGLVCKLGLESKMLVRVHTFGKALAATGAVVLSSQLIKDYLINYARPLIYTTAISPINAVAVNCSIDLLENGVAQELSERLFELSAYLISTLHTRLLASSIPSHLISLPTYLTSPTSSSPLYSPIIPLLTSLPRPLSAHLLTHARANARPITWPTVPKGADRVRVCLHAGNTTEEVDRLIDGVVGWAKDTIKEKRGKIGQMGVRQWAESKL